MFGHRKAPMPTPAKKKRDAAAKAQAASETESTYKNNETSFGNGDGGRQLPYDEPLNDKTVDFHQHNPESFKAITANSIDQASIMVMVLACEGYGNPDEFDEHLSMNVDIAK